MRLSWENGGGAAHGIAWELPSVLLAHCCPVGASTLQQSAHEVALHIGGQRHLEGLQEVDVVAQAVLAVLVAIEQVVGGAAAAVAAAATTVRGRVEAYASEGKSVRTGLGREVHRAAHEGDGQCPDNIACHAVRLSMGSRSRGHHSQLILNLTATAVRIGGGAVAGALAGATRGSGAAASGASCGGQWSTAGRVQRPHAACRAALCGRGSQPPARSTGAHTQWAVFWSWTELATPHSANWCILWVTQVALVCTALSAGTAQPKTLEVGLAPALPQWYWEPAGLVCRA